MQDKETEAPSGADRTPYIPKPPTKADLDQVSREQALITDEWAEPSQVDGMPENTTPEKPAP